MTGYFIPKIELSIIKEKLSFFTLEKFVILESE